MLTGAFIILAFMKLLASPPFTLCMHSFSRK